MAISHRIARRDDLADIVAIYNASIPSRLATADTEPVSVESRVSWFDAHPPQARPLWVAEAAGSIAGWLSFSTFYGRPAYQRTAELSVYVHPGFHRRGIAAYLVDQALAHAPAIGVNTVLGFIFGHNAASLALFERFGFERWGYLPGVAVLDNTERDLIIVGRRV